MFEEVDNLILRCKEEQEMKDYLERNIYPERLKNKFNFDENELAKGKIGVLNFIGNLLLAIILLPFSVYGFVANAWLFYLTRIPYRSMLKDDQFYFPAYHGATVVRQEALDANPELLAVLENAPVKKFQHNNAE